MAGQRVSDEELARLAVVLAQDGDHYITDYDHEVVLDLIDCRAELERQWWANHAEHCETRYPHPKRYRCSWPRPPELGAMPKRTP
jgi:hypothetical protein